MKQTLDAQDSDSGETYLRRLINDTGKDSWEALRDILEIEDIDVNKLLSVSCQTLGEEIPIPDHPTRQFRLTRNSTVDKALKHQQAAHL